MNITVVLSMLSAAMWILFGGLVMVAISRAARQRPVRGLQAAILAAGIGALLFSTASASVVFIEPQYRGVVESAVAQGGYRPEALQPGLNWVVPFLESVKKYSISKQTYTMSIATNEGQVVGDDSITARTSDGQELYIDASVIYSIDPEQVIKIHISWQERYAEGLVRPQARAVIRDIISQYGVEEVITAKRDEIISEMNRRMAEELADDGLLLDDFVLRNITFSQDYAASVEQKQIAEQRAQEARLTVEQKRQEAEQARQEAQGVADAVVIASKGAAEARLIQAEAEARALEMLSKVLQGNQTLVQYLFVNRIAPGVQTIFLPNDGSYLLPLPTTAPGSSVIPNGVLPPFDPALPVVPTPIPTPTPTP